MINLLPPNAKNKLAWDRRLRLFSVAIILFSVVFLLLALLSLPVSVVQKYQIDSIREDKQFTLEVEAKRKEKEKENEEINKVLSHIANTKESTEYWSMVAKIDELAGVDISVETFNFNEDQELTITGVSKTRSALSDFRDKLEEEKAFSSVELPLSSLVDETDATFTITLDFK